MGRKKSGRFQKKENITPKKSAYYFDENDDNMMNDEIDAFHKQRDVVPLDLNEDAGESDEDNEQPVLDLADDDRDDEEDSEEDDEDMEDDSQLKGLAAKIARQQKYLQARMGGLEDEMDDASEDEAEERRVVWGKNKNIYYHADNVDYELQSSDEDAPAEEEAEALKLQKERAESLTTEDFGLEEISDDESDKEPTIEESLVHGKRASKPSAGEAAKDKTATIFASVKKDLDALTREEQMDVVYSSAPELVGLLSELNNAFEQLETKVDPLSSKIVEGKDGMKGGLHYLEMKRLLLLSYCQSITFYLLLKSEGRSARDHPVISQLVELRTLLDKVKELDGYLPANLEDIIDKNIVANEKVKLGCAPDSFTNDHTAPVVSAENHNITKPFEVIEMLDLNSSKDQKEGGAKRKHQDTQVGLQSMEMLKVRAALEERLKKKGVFSSLPQQNRIRNQRQLINGQLETLDDFDDDAMGGDGSERSSKLSRLVTSQAKKPKIISGDDDLPQRDDIGERRRKHELRVLSRAGIKSADEVQDDFSTPASDGISGDDSDLDISKHVEQQHAAKVAAKAELSPRPSTVPSLPEAIVDGKRQINYQMEKNRGLTRSRKKLTKNPRKKYRVQHQKKVTNWGGQVRKHKTPTGPYGGETSGINAGISRSIRF